MWPTLTICTYWNKFKNTFMLFPNLMIFRSILVLSRRGIQCNNYLHQMSCPKWNLALVANFISWSRLWHLTSCWCTLTMYICWTFDEHLIEEESGWVFPIVGFFLGLWPKSWCLYCVWFSYVVPLCSTTLLVLFFFLYNCY